MVSRSNRTALTAALAVGAVGVGAAVWGIGVERHLYTVRRHRVPLLPPGATPIRVLHLSDAHIAPWQRRKSRWIAGLAELGPDLIVNTGDNLGHANALPILREALEPFRGVPGVFVHGSNDLTVPSLRNPLRYLAGPSEEHPDEEPIDTAAMDEFFADLGWADLNNAAVAVPVRDTSVTAFGVDDAHRDLDRLAAVPEALAGISPPGDVTLGVTHAPYRRILDSFVTFGADMIFAGHTHGGQVRIPFSGRALVANCDIPLDQARGLSSWTVGSHTVPLNVSAGIGHSIWAPVRFATRPEASLITLLPQGDSHDSEPTG